MSSSITLKSGAMSGGSPLLQTGMASLPPTLAGVRPFAEHLERPVFVGLARLDDVVATWAAIFCAFRDRDVAKSGSVSV